MNELKTINGLIGRRKSDGISLASLRLFIRLSISLFTISLFNYFTSVPAFAAFKETGWGTRPSGMGGAFTAVADDANSSLYNPAGLARMESREFMFTYSKPYMGLDLKAGTNGSTTLGMNSLSLVTPIAAQRWGAVGFSWASFGASGLYSENTYVLSYSRSLHDLLWPSKEFGLYTGFNIKSMSHEYELDALTRQTEATSSRSPFAKGTSASAMSVDWGLQMNPLDYFWVGLLGKNLNSPDVGLAETDTIPREYRLGLAWKIPQLVGFEDFQPTLELSYRKPQGNDADLRVHFGMESWFSDHTYALRMGGNDRELSFGGGWNREFSRLSIQLDYAFVLSTTLEDNSGTHRISIVLRQAVVPKEERSEVSSPARWEPVEEKPIARPLPPPPPAPKKVEPPPKKTVPAVKPLPPPPVVDEEDEESMDEEESEEAVPAVRPVPTPAVPVVIPPPPPPAAQEELDEEDEEEDDYLSDDEEDAPEPPKKTVPVPKPVPPPPPAKVESPKATEKPAPRTVSEPPKPAPVTTGVRSTGIKPANAESSRPAKEEAPPQKEKASPAPSTTTGIRPAKK